MRELFRNTPFSMGFALAILVMFILNALSRIAVRDELANREFQFDHYAYTYGFPFEMHHVTVGNPSSSSFITSGVLGNGLITILLGFAFGLIFMFVWSKLRSSK